ncbi:hypothetical protein [Flavobacterium sp. J27]|uniref:hypothetical protein n=1 Tax=Flavobacterium sp. J27 TaxID=2060419 RepID=UPI0010300C61|nr:hypothetical protein [Flavobacterium sp. J27]
MNKIVKIVVFFVITFLVVMGFLKGIKYYSIKKIESNKSIETYKTEIFEHNKIKYEIGNIGKYPCLKILANSDKEWKVINLRGLIKDAFPSNTYYYGFKGVDNTVWFYELETCIECDGSNKLHNIHYSHDNGNTWFRVDHSYVKQNAHIEFINDKKGFITVYINDLLKRYETQDGGLNWREITE